MMVATPDDANSQRRTTIGELMKTPKPPALEDNDMPAEIDFSGGTRGKFYRPDTRINLPLYLDADVQDYLVSLARQRGVSFSDLANELLRKEIAIREGAK
jgi:hypothetical protein